MKFSILLAALIVSAAPLAAQSGGFLGVQIGESESTGALITGVQKGTAAEVVGLKKGDLILAVGKQKVGGPQDLVRLISSQPAGAYIKLTLRRNGEVVVKPVILGRRSGSAPAVIDIADLGDLPRGLFTPRAGGGSRFRLSDEGGRWRLEGEDREQLEQRIGQIRERQRGMIREIEERTHGLLREHGIDSLEGGRYRIHLPEGLGRFNFEDLEHGDLGRMEFRFQHEGSGGDWTDLLKNLHLAGDTGDGSGVIIVLPERIPGAQRDEIRDRIKSRFGPKATIKFDGSMMKMSFSSEGGMSFDMDDWGAEDFKFGPLEIDVRGFDGGFDLVVPELRKKSAKKPAKKETSRSSKVGYHKSLEQAMKKASKSGKPILVDFYADWCGPCRRLGDEVLSNAKHRGIVGAFEVVKINVDENRGLADEYEVQGIPDLRILTADGRQIDRLVGYAGEESMIAQLNKALEQASGKGRVGRARAHFDVDSRQRAELEAQIAKVQAQIRKLEAELQRLRSGAR